MQTIMTPVDAIIYHDKNGNMLPKRIRYRDSGPGDDVTVNVDRAILSDVVGGRTDRRRIYRCRSVVNDVIRDYELMYDISSTNWFLYRV